VEHDRPAELAVELAVVGELLQASAEPIIA
jgi:hypothetical protein